MIFSLSYIKIISLLCFRDISSRLLPSTNQCPPAESFPLICKYAQVSPNSQNSPWIHILFLLKQPHLKKKILPIFFVFVLCHLLLHLLKLNSASTPPKTLLPKVGNPLSVTLSKGRFSKLVELNFQWDLVFHPFMGFHDTTLVC